MTLIDSHCHLAGEEFAGDLEAVVARARAAGVARVLCILSLGHDAEARQATRLAGLWPEARFAIGVHPHEAARFADALQSLPVAIRAAVAENPLARAIGEIGLDYHYDFSPRDAQRDVFRAQVRLARELDLPVVIHTREAAEDTFAILREEGGGRVRGVFHCFTGDRAMADEALALDFDLSFAGIVTFPKAAALREVVKAAPAERFLLETDSPYLAPVPHRGRRCEPAFVRDTAAAVAAARSETPDAVAAATTRAFERCFRP